MREDCIISRFRRNKRPAVGRFQNETLMRGHGLPYSCRNKTNGNAGVGASICYETGSGWEYKELYEKGDRILDR